MSRDKDYRNTEYCPKLDKVEEQKHILEKEIKLELPRTKIVYNKVNNRDSIYHKKFAQIYNRKCAYCGTYQDDKCIQQFYESLHLGYETRRLDYLGLQLEGKYRAEKDKKRKNKLGESLSILLKKRNRMTVTGRLL